MSVPEHWATASLAEITSKVGSGATPRGGADVYAASGVPLIRSMNVVFFGFKRDGLAYLHPKHAAELANVEVRANDVLLNITGASIGRVTVAPDWLDGARVNQHVCIVRPSGAMQPQLLAAYLSTAEMQRQIAGDQYGMTRQALTKQQVLGFEIPVPPRAEQQRIAAKLNTLLGRVDACRERLERVRPLIKRFRQSVLEAAMTGTLTAELHAQGAAPEWEPAELGDVADVGTGSTPLRSEAGYFADEGTPWVTSAATTRSLITAASEFVTPAAVQAHRLRLYPPGTLLVAMYGEGKTRGQVAELGIAATINQACAAITGNSHRVTKAFLKLALQSNYLTMRAMAEGGNQPNLNLSKVRAVKLMLPGEAEQVEIVRRVGKIFALADALEARLALARRAATALTPATLAKAFRGELVPQDPNDEPAAALLARLQAERDAAAPGANAKRARRARSDG